MSAATSARLGIDTQAPRKGLGQQTREDTASVGTGMSAHRLAPSIWTRLETLVLLLTALMTLWLMGSIATQFQIYWH